MSELTHEQLTEIAERSYEEFCDAAPPEIRKALRGELRGSFQKVYEHGFADGCLFGAQAMRQKLRKLWA